MCRFLFVFWRLEPFCLGRQPPLSLDPEATAGDRRRLRERGRARLRRGWAIPGTTCCVAVVAADSLLTIVAKTAA